MVDTNVEPFSMKQIADAPREIIKDINDLLKSSSDIDDEQKGQSKKKQVIPVVEGFFTNVRPN